MAAAAPRVSSELAAAEEGVDGAPEESTGGGDSAHADGSGGDDGSDESGSYSSESGSESSSDDGGYRAPIMDGRKVTFTVRDLNAHLVCSLCDCYFRNATAITACLPKQCTFCRDCIKKHLAYANTCPKCTTVLGQDACRDDHIIQSLIDKVFPAEIAASAESAAGESSGMKRKASADGDRGGSAGASDEMKRRRTDDDDQEAMAFRLEALVETDPERQLGNLPKPFLRTTGKLQIIHIKKYLAGKIAFRIEKDAASGEEKRVEYALDETDIDILCKEEVLGDELNLNFIKATRWIGGGVESNDLELKFRKKL